MCPNGCRVEVTYEPASAPGEAPEIISTYGNLCPRGAGYARQELIDPRRTIAIRDLLGLGSDVIVTKTVDVSRGRIR